MTDVDQAMREIIAKQLTQIEQEEQVRIIYACESGSRAWGFPSQDSDYDVRFIYVRPLEWYLSIEDQRDVIERPISDQLDINGWDIRKALKLFRKSNPPLLEWLQSPIQYDEQYSVAGQIRSLSPLTFSPKSCLYHYLNMAKGNFRDYLQGEQVKIKKYFYVLRPLLACGWIERYETMPPMAFDKLVETLVPAGTPLYTEIHDLLRRKKAGDELDMEPQLPAIQAYITAQIAHVEQLATEIQGQATVEIEVLNRIFQSAVQEVWA
ncbi:MULTISPECIES: nucleotidyltransferase domain-containing protein [Paenibacillus]|uniref:Nucleotidyltransferase domain-containing protein n=1 Tax=Paenibacillus cucumis (ex Kampfer et al. 2016) TaxID=1776858 RepID=A0ABS7KFH6_9BACL|nr:nucleotidyltransferase domain-containing protein [Paenibacillus cucumis (ex Kampfer et al. 2016)]MBY0202866.1 nucleotidyltransferase domain-containing protein [Paenibacillus cucumis (ex Kampfer et al. 2016)]MDP9700740.1 putative nucleotidyltransferase [Paenibacillus intestini]